MIQRGLKNFFHNLKFYFTPLGVVALSVIISLAIVLPVFSGSVRSLADSVSSLDGVSLDFNAFVRTVIDAGIALDWRNPSEAFSTLLSKEWLTKTFQDGIFALSQEAVPVADQILLKIESCVTSIFHAAIAVIVFVFLGIIGGFLITKALIRKEIAKRTLVKTVLITIVDSLIMAALPLLTIFLGARWKPSVYLSIVLYPLLWALITLFEALIVHGAGKVKSKDVINLKNCASLMLVNFMIIIISSAFTSLITALTDKLIGLLLGLPILEIAYIVMGLNAESYVKELAEKSPAPPADRIKTKEKSNGTK